MRHSASMSYTVLNYIFCNVAWHNGCQIDICEVMGNDTMEIPDHVYMLIPRKFAESVSLTLELS